MWKLLLWICIVIVILVGLPALPVFAASSADISITATGLLVAPDAPADFTVFYINDYIVGISWTKPEGVVNTMIRAKYGSAPLSRNDGYLVYYGEGNTTNDTAVSLDEVATQVYYRAWTENATGGWSTQYGEGQMEGIGVTLLALILGVVGLSAIAAKSSYFLISVLAGIFWWGIGVFWQVNPPSNITAGSSAHVIVLAAFFIIGVAFMFMPFWYPKTANGKEIGGRIRLPFMRTDEQEEEEKIRRYMPTRQERADAYSRKVRAAFRGETRRRR